jgi:ABC-type multidrug transport system fused ATPase/permease subunit
MSDEPKKRKRRKHITYIPLVGIDARFLHYVFPYASLLLLSALLILLVAFFDIIAPWPLKYIVDHVINGRPFSGSLGGEWVAGILGDDKRWQAAFLGFALLVITVLQGGAAFAYEYLIGVIQERATYGLRSSVFDRVARLPLEFFDQNRLGDVIKRVTEDAGKIMIALVGSMGEFLVNTIKFMGFAFVMIFVNWRFSIIVLAYVPLILFLYITFRNNIRATAQESRKLEGEMMNLTLETLSAIREVKAFGQEANQLAKFDERGDKRVQSMLRSIRWEASFSPVIDFVQAASTAAVVWYGVSQVLVGNFTVGDLLIFMAYLKDMYSPLRRFSKLSANWQKAAASADRLGKVLDAKFDWQEKPDALPIGRVRGDVYLENVSFAYPSAPDRVILQGMNLRVNAGKIIALVGATGAGKSTITNLLMRFYEATEGRILLDGHDIRDLKLADLRRQFAVVPQESVLFATTLAENIAYGRPDASRADIVAAAHAANIHDFIRSLPEGYETVVGERGATLSGGQRQRIAIARALLRDAPLLILDEPTAALDARSEEKVMNALERLMVGRTTFIIAHRLSTVRQADLIVVLENGRVVEQGKHAELMARRGQYAHLTQLQQGDVAPTMQMARSYLNGV